MLVIRNLSSLEPFSYVSWVHGRCCNSTTSSVSQAIGPFGCVFNYVVTRYEEVSFYFTENFEQWCYLLWGTAVDMYICCLGFARSCATLLKNKKMIRTEECLGVIGVCFQKGMYMRLQQRP